MSPATQEEIFCASSHVVKAMVKRAPAPTSACVQQSSQYCLCSGELVVEVESVLGMKKSVSDYPEDVGISEGKEVRLWWQEARYLSRPSSQQVCADIQPVLLGKEFIFSIGTRYGLWGDGTTHVSRPPYGAHLWPLGQANWVQNLLATGNGISCPALSK